MDLFNRKKVAELIREKYELIQYNESVVKTFREELEESRKENEKLTNWIITILKEIGIKNTADANSVKIPYTSKIELYYGFDTRNVCEETIQLPAITLRKRG